MGGRVEERFLVGNGESKYLQEVRHLCASGSNREIGRALAEYAKAHYGIAVGRLGKYGDAKGAQERMRYYEQNWREMAERAAGVEDAFAAQLAGNKNPDLYDFSALVYDVSADAPFGQCSAVYIPPACSSTGHPLIARNYDAWRIEAHKIFRSPDPELPLYSRPFVLELQPKKGRKIIALGGHDLLCPFQDAINQDGLFITSLADDAHPLKKGMTMAGGNNTNLGSRQVLLMLAEKCGSVAEVKKMLPTDGSVRMRRDIGLHWLIADAEGAATLLAIRDGLPLFTDAAKDRPFLVTNHPIDAKGRNDALRGALESRKKHCDRVPGRKNGAHCQYPRCMTGTNSTCRWRPGWNFAYDTFKRMQVLKRRVRGKRTPCSPKYATGLMDLVACAFAKPEAAGVAPSRQTRTIWSVTTELRRENPQLSLRLYLEAGKPDRPNSNHLEIEWAAWTIGFGHYAERQAVGPTGRRSAAAVSGRAPAPPAPP